MEYKVLGLQRKTGEYQGKAFDNTLIHCTFKDAKVTGTGVEVLKVKTENCPPLSIGATVVPVYNRFGNIDTLYISKEDTGK